MTINDCDLEFGKWVQAALCRQLMSAWPRRAHALLLDRLRSDHQHMSRVTTLFQGKRSYPDIRESPDRLSSYSFSLNAVPTDRRHLDDRKGFYKENYRLNEFIPPWRLHWMLSFVHRWIL